MVKWGTAATGKFFRTLYNGGIWLSREDAQVAMENGWNSTDPKQKKGESSGTTTFRRPCDLCQFLIFLRFHGRDHSSFVSTSCMLSDDVHVRATSLC